MTFSDRKVIIGHSISKGIYCEVKGDTLLTVEEVDLIKNRMQEIVASKIPFVKKIMSIDEAKEVFRKVGRMDRYHAIEHREKPYVTIYKCEEFEDYFYGYMVPDTGYLKYFDVKYYSPGLILMYPDKSNPEVIPKFKEQKKLFSIFRSIKTGAIYLELPMWAH